jgi:hypothetical protein
VGQTEGDPRVQPLPLAAAGTGRRRPARRGPLPGCLAGVELVAVDRPDGRVDNGRWRRSGWCVTLYRINTSDILHTLDITR